MSNDNGVSGASLCKRQYRSRRYSKPLTCEKTAGHRGWHKDGPNIWPTASGTNEATK